MREELTHAVVQIGGDSITALAEVARTHSFAAEPDAVLMSLSVQKSGVFPDGPPCEDPYRQSIHGQIKTEMDDLDREYERDCITEMGPIVPSTHLDTLSMPPRVPIEDPDAALITSMRDYSVVPEPHEDAVPRQHVPGMFVPAIPVKMGIAGELIRDREEIERICQTPEANKFASEPLDLKKDLVTYADHQIFSTELERRMDELGLMQKKIFDDEQHGMKAHLEFGSWMVPHRRILHTPVVKVQPTRLSRTEIHNVKDLGAEYAIDHVNKYFQQRCNPLPLSDRQILDLPTQEAFWYNGGRRYPQDVEDGVEAKTFGVVTISDATPTYLPEEIAALGPEIVAPDLECPMHFFGPPDGEFTGTTIQVRSPGPYHTESGIVQMPAGTFKIFKGVDRIVRFEMVRAFEMSEVMRLRIGRQVRNNIQWNLTENDRRRRYGIPNAKDLAELKARDCLRDMLSEADWRRYVTNSFLMVRGESGKWYQLFENGERIRVYLKGQYIGSICIHTDGGCPPTDHVIAMKLLIELDEDALWVEGNVSRMDQNPWREALEQGPPGKQIGVPKPPNLVDTVKLLRHGMVV